ncbi:hypothetical protein K504DRAFT_286476 [Pleomassaria siparia CBS 279.74]|uniref:Uncharacterized protein n=1 Tax=Pleomassaria siparia CBS 279.74 TaxID=1314801 RepID=A0A6G1K6Y6_9PLEO|nr:hypothetical protein K504DRAFT_286476 [Pleomassaria siparia CBS 279.74]
MSSIYTPGLNISLPWIIFSLYNLVLFLFMYLNCFFFIISKYLIFEEDTSLVSQSRYRTPSNSGRHLLHSSSTCVLRLRFHSILCLLQSRGLGL